MLSYLSLMKYVKWVYDECYFSSMKRIVMIFHPKKCDYGKVNPIRVDCDTFASCSLLIKK